MIADDYLDNMENKQLGLDALQDRECQKAGAMRSAPRVKLQMSDFIVDRSIGEGWIRYLVFFGLLFSLLPESVGVHWAEERNGMRVYTHTHTHIYILRGRENFTVLPFACLFQDHSAPW